MRGFSLESSDIHFRSGMYLNTDLKVETFSELAQMLEGGSCSVSFWGGRQVTLKNSKTSDLMELGNQVTNLFLEKGCPSTERAALKTISKQLSKWFQETDESVKTTFKITQMSDFFSYPTENVTSFWKPGAAGIAIENLYSDEEWKEQFPDSKMPEPIQVIGKFKLFSDEQIGEAEEFVLV